MSFIDFAIVGAMKSGTTTLAKILSEHPDVDFCQIKEPHFFSKSPHWQENLEDYRQLYQLEEHKIRGEASTSYTCYPEFNLNTCQSLYEFNPNLKIIYIMREPTNRIVSHYLHNYLRGYTSRTFEQVIFKHSQYINRTRYFMQIKPYIDLFGRGQVLLLTFEEFIQNKKNTINKVTNFLNIDSNLLGNFDQIHANQSSRSGKINIKLEQVVDSPVLKTVAPLFPQNFRKISFKLAHHLTKRKLTDKPMVSPEIKKAIYELLFFDLREMEKLMDRELTEWQWDTKQVDN